MGRSAIKIAMYVMWQTGCRVSEASKLRWTDICEDDLGCWVNFTGGKTGARRTPISREAFEHLHAFRGEKDLDSPVFRNSSRVPNAAGAVMAEACRLRGFEPFTAHGLCRMFTDRCMRAGVDVAGPLQTDGFRLALA